MKTAVVRSAAQKLSNSESGTPILVGFDGFIDEVIRVVDKRENTEKYTTLPSIAAFGDRISQYAGLSGNLELVTTMTKLGGNGPIMANAMGPQGASVSYVGCIGSPSIHPLFDAFAASCDQVISIAQPALTDALEFDDGKLMFGKHSSLKDVNWEQLLSTAGEEALRALIAKVAFIACTNWTMLTQMNSIIVGMTDILRSLPDRKRVFIDLADPTKRTDEDIRGVLALLQSMQEVADVILGLNENESELIAKLVLDSACEELTERAVRIQKALNLHTVVIHPTRGAAVANATASAFMAGPYTPKPKLTTGAGDNFNAGFCTGVLAGLSPEECLATGVCSSGFYVRNCRSATREELIGFMNSWADVDCGDLP